MCVCVNVFMSMYVCVCLCVCVFSCHVHKITLLSLLAFSCSRHSSTQLSIYPSSFISSQFHLSFLSKSYRKIEHAARLLLERGYTVDVAYTSMLKRYNNTHTHAHRQTYTHTEADIDR